MKKRTKLAIKKVTLRNLDEPTLDAMAGGGTKATCKATCPHTCQPNDCCSAKDGCLSGTCCCIHH